MSIWTIDPSHSEVQFKVKHLVISTVTGSFKSFNATVTSSSDDFAGASINFDADINSLNTGVEQRDEHLKSDDFFAADKFPKLSFVSKSLVGSGNSFKLSGNLTIRDITKEVQLDVTYGGTMVDFYGNTKAGFEINGVINRKDFGLQWTAITEAGGVVVGDEVKLIANIQVQKAV